MLDLNLGHIVDALVMAAAIWLFIMALRGRIVDVLLLRIRSAREILQEAIERLEKDPQTDETQKLIAELRQLAAEDAPLSRSDLWAALDAEREIGRKNEEFRQLQARREARKQFRINIIVTILSYCWLDTIHICASATITT